MTSFRFAATAFAVVLLFGIAPSPQSEASPIPAEPGFYGQEPWAIPPAEFNEMQRRAFLDGIEGAKRDYGNHRNPDVNNREEYRNPDVPPDLREAYRAAFRHGYDIAASRWWGTPPPAPLDWGMRGLESEAERQGYHEGKEAARRDFETQRRADPDDHEEFRNPRVPPGLADEFREGFMRGYEVAMSQLRGEGPWQASGDPNQWIPLQRFSEIQRRGFHDGVEGAHKDFGNHRRPNVANREEYREPHMDQAYWHEYREGFRRGYEMAASQLWGGM